MFSDFCCFQDFDDILDNLCGKAPDGMTCVFIEQLSGFPFAEGVILAAFDAFVGEVIRLYYFPHSIIFAISIMISATL